jgi:hypothetical protein
MQVSLNNPDLKVSFFYYTNISRPFFIGSGTMHLWESNSLDRFFPLFASTCFLQQFVRSNVAVRSVVGQDIWPGSTNVSSTLLMALLPLPKPYGIISRPIGFVMSGEVCPVTYAIAQLIPLQTIGFARGLQLRGHAVHE